MPPEEAFVQADGIRLHHWEWGERHRPPVVLAHATGFLARLWQPVAEALSDRPDGRPSGRFHVHAYDSRGHGDSDKPVLSGADPPQAESGAEGPGSDYHWQRFVDDLRGFLDALGLRDVLAVGHSGGGAAAAYLAATRPGYISRLVLIEPIIPPPNADPAGASRHDLAAGARRRRMVWPSRDELLHSYRRRPTFARWRDDVLRLYAEYGAFTRDDGQVQLKCPGEVEAQIFENSSSLDTWEMLPRITCPTLVMRGEHTAPYLAWMCEGVAARIPAARLVTIPEAGHLAPMERPEAVAAEVLAFAQQADAHRGRSP